MNPFALALTTLFHPIDSLDIIKRERERKRALIPAVVLLLLAFFVNYLYVFIVSFQLQEKEAIDANLLLECGIIGVPLITWVVASFGITSILSGESKLPEIFIASCYSLTPFIVFTPILAALSHILSTSEQGVYTFLRTGLVVWVVLLIFLSLKKLNDYGFMKTVLVAIIALAFMVIILAVVILLVSLTAQLITFFTGLWEEIDLKYIH
ncbi:MAG: hypothetical protein KHX46_00540 [Clostridiales bacterium]|nr:hypothetical protein [Clostridiales bacterium]